MQRAARKVSGPSTGTGTAKAEVKGRRRPAPRGPRRGYLRLLLLLLLPSLTAPGAAGCRGRAEDRPPGPSGAPARRIVSLAPNLTEIVFALGAGDRLVGVSDYSDYPPEARALPRVGGLEVSAERVASLQPDLVLATEEGGNAKGAVSALQSAGVPVLAVPGASLSDVLKGIRAVGARVGRSAEAERLARSLEERRSAVAARTSARGSRRPRAVLLVWPEPPQAAGAGTFLDDVLTAAGAENLLASQARWPVVSPEWLATAPIEILVVPDSPANRPVFDRAFATGALSRGSAAKARIIRVDESSLTRPGPRVFDALEALAAELAK